MDRILLEGIELDLARRLVVHADGRTVRLTELEAGLLAHLAARPGGLVSKDELLREVWGYAPGVQSRAVDYTVRRLRKKIEPDPRAPVHLVGVYGGKLGLEGVLAPVPAAGRPARGRRSRSLPTPPIDAVIGRQSERSWLSATIADGARLVVLLGPAGIGKTRLLLEAAHTLGPEPVRWLDLGAEGPVGTEAAAEALLADCLGGAPTSASRGWVILDEAERGAAALQAALPRWLAAAPGLRFVVGSRRRLSVPGAALLWLPPLSEAAAVRLFEGRAAAAGALLAAGAPETVRLVDALERRPLAIELAAVRAGVRTVQALLSAVVEPLACLQDPRPGGRSLRAALLRSVELLNIDERAVLGKCAVLPGRFGRAHAEAVAGPGAVAVLDRLRDHSLVRAHPGPQRSFELMLGVRALALETLSDEDRCAAEDALVAWMAGRVGEERPRLLPLDWMRGELALLRALHDRFATRDPGVATRLAVWAAPVLWERGCSAEALRRLGPVPPGSLAGLVRGRLLGELGRYDEALAVLEVAAEHEEQRLRGWARLTLAGVVLITGEPQRAEPLLRLAVADMTTTGDDRGLALALLRQALALRFLGRAEEGLAVARRARPVWERVGDPVGLAVCDVDTGLMLRVLGQLGEARRLLKRALPVFEERGVLRRAARLRTNLGVLAAERGDRKLAGAHYRAALGLQQQLGNRRGEATVRINLGSIACQEGLIGEAEAHLREALDIAEELGLGVLRATALGGHGVVRFFEGRRFEALRELEAAARALDGRAFLHNAAWCVTFAGVIRALEGLPPATGLPAPACPELVAAAERLAAGDRSGAHEVLRALPREGLERDDGRALLAWLEARLSPAEHDGP